MGPNSQACGGDVEGWREVKGHISQVQQEVGGCGPPAHQTGRKAINAVAGIAVDAQRFHSKTHNNTFLLKICCGSLLSH